ncbi:S1-like domain-containing RNA-binding protein [Pseudocolwellia sp. AS88]|jgi:predicted RNA-binding protein (virulence factor B family)|uniref:CvfB family protein n=1 Tax=Pseudocolwellia sp. AS88 TaxID=3063958 RepID=UPI0026EF13B0|nr:S1-like domain-containing RNA-binding protein [Pseudocolwellia sp. AS88]MDO7084326.1 S1-like domain-containing RNA-binding protein [Pseudocolwellia sp. AS88]
MADLGKFNTLSVITVNDTGAYLNADDLGEVLLPNRLIPENCTAGSQVSVFLYKDSADRVAATTQQPLGEVDQFVSLKVSAINKMGAFLDWGLPKELLVPYNEQHTEMEVGKYYLVRIYLDLRTERIVASSKLDKFIDVWPADYQKWDKVDLIIGGKTDLGFKAIINNLHWGLLYDNEIFQPLRIGKKITGYIKQVREDERIDLSLSRPGEGKVNDFSQKLLDYIAEHNGVSPLHDKSSPDDIQKALGVSKKTFKATVGNLLKKGKVKITPEGITLI